MTMSTTYVGMDAHAATIQITMLQPGAGQPQEWQLANELRALRRLARRLKRTAPGPIVACYEAGPCGFALQRRLQAEGIDCQVIAPALIPRKPGDRVKTDRRDARKLAELLRAGLLTAVHPPSPEQEAVRDLCRAREDAVADRTRAQHRLAKLLIRQGIAYDGRRWTQAHRRWLLTLRFEHPAAQATFDDYLRAIEGLDERLRTLEQQLVACADSDDYREPAGLLRCFRGIDTVTAMTLLAELGDITRFGSARQLMAYLGLTPSESSSGARQHRGPITKTGKRPCPAGAGRVRLALPPPTARGRGAAQTPCGPAGLGGRPRGPSTEPAPSPLPPAGRTRQADAPGERRGRARARGLPMGGAAGPGRAPRRRLSTRAAAHRSTTARRSAAEVDG